MLLRLKFKKYLFVVRMKPFYPQNEKKHTIRPSKEYDITEGNI